MTVPLRCLATKYNFASDTNRVGACGCCEVAPAARKAPYALLSLAVMVLLCKCLFHVGDKNSRKDLKEGLQLEDSAPP